MHLGHRLPINMHRLDWGSKPGPLHHLTSLTALWYVRTMYIVIYIHDHTPANKVLVQCDHRWYVVLAFLE